MREISEVVIIYPDVCGYLSNILRYFLCIHEMVCYMRCIHFVIQLNQQDQEFRLYPCCRILQMIHMIRLSLQKVSLRLSLRPWQQLGTSSVIGGFSASDVWWHRKGPVWPGKPWPMSFPFWIPVRSLRWIIFPGEAMDLTGCLYRRLGASPLIFLVQIHPS